MYIFFGFKYTAELTFVKQPQLHHEDMYSLKMWITMRKDRVSLNPSYSCWLNLGLHNINP